MLSFVSQRHFWKQFRHAANKIYSHVTGGCRIIVSKKTMPSAQVRKSEMTEMMSKKSEEGFMYKESLPGEDDESVILVFEED